MPMRKFRWLLVHLLALTVLADGFAIVKPRTILPDHSETHDLTPSASAAQHITKIPRSKQKAPSTTTAKPTETTTVTNDDVTSSINDIEGKSLKPRKSSQDTALTDIASSGNDNATPNTTGTVQNDAPVESTPASVTNNETKGNTESEDPSLTREVVTEVSGNAITNSSSAFITTLDSEEHYPTASVNDNVDNTITSTTGNSEEPVLLRGQFVPGNVSERNNSVNALVDEYSKVDTMAESPPDMPFKPYSKPILEDREKHLIRGEGSFDDEPTQTKNGLDPRKDIMSSTIPTVLSSDSQIQSRSDDTQDGIVYLSESTTQEAPETKTTKKVSNEEKNSASSTTNYGDKLDIPTNLEQKHSTTVNENQGPLDDVTMDETSSWRREDAAIVTSMRGGYINHSPYVKKVAPIETDQPDEENETEPKKSTTTIASQSLVVDDQLKESIPAEERLREEELARTQSGSGERPLTVKPIGKNNTLYTVNPNYKPMKKLDVVPGKQFLRDPDDNSWRNESLNSLGIVFKGKNSTKSFTQVLKNKTDTELSNGTEKDIKPEAPELRERLEKLAEERKSKKKKTDKSGEVADYDEIAAYLDKAKTHRGYSAPRLSPKARVIFKTSQEEFDYHNADDDVEYVTLPFLDIKKSSPSKSAIFATTPPPITTRGWAKPPTTRQHPDRKPTVQYFPPRPRTETNVYVRNTTEEDDFQRKMKSFMPELDAPISTPDLALKDKEIPVRTNFYIADTPKPSTTLQVPVEKAYSFRDILARINHEEDYDRVNEYIPIQRVKDVLTQRDPTPIRHEVIEKFIENFNDNSRKFNVDYPVVYKSRVVHTDGSDVSPASSSASMKQQYSKSRSAQDLEPRRQSNRNCDKPVELSTDYELHYYIPEQEEKVEFGKIIP